MTVGLFPLLKTLFMSVLELIIENEDSGNFNPGKLFVKSECN